MQLEKILPVRIWGIGGGGEFGGGIGTGGGEGRGGRDLEPTVD